MIRKRRKEQREHRRSFLITTPASSTLRSSGKRKRSDRKPTAHTVVTSIIQRMKMAESSKYQSSTSSNSHSAKTPISALIAEAVDWQGSCPANLSQEEWLRWYREVYRPAMYQEVAESLQRMEWEPMEYERFLELPQAHSDFLEAEIFV